MLATFVSCRLATERKMSRNDSTDGAAPSATPAGGDIEPNVLHTKVPVKRLESKSTQETPRVLTHEKSDPKQRASLNLQFGRRTPYRPSTRNSTHSARSSHSDCDQNLPEKELFHRFRHVYAGKGGWLHGSRSGVPPNVTPWGSSGQRYRQEILRKLARTFNKRSAGLHRPSSGANEAVEGSGSGQQCSTSPSQFRFTPRGPLIPGQDINSRDAVLMPSEEIAARASPNYRSNRADQTTNDAIDVQQEPAEDDQQASLRAPAALIGLGAKACHPPGQQEINASTGHSNRLHVQGLCDNTNIRSTCPSDINKSRQETTIESGLENSASSLDRSRLVNQDYTSDVTKERSDNPKQTISEINASRSSLTEPRCMDTALADCDRDGPTTTNNERLMYNEEINEQPGSGSKESHKRETNKRSQSRKNAIVGRAAKTPTCCETAPSSDSMPLLSLLSVEARKALNETREEMDVNDIDNGANVPSSLLEINKLLVQRMNYSQHGDDSGSDRDSRVNIPNDAIVEQEPDMACAEQLPTSSHERKLRKAREHIANPTSKTVSVHKPRISETQISDDRTTYVKQKLNNSVIINGQPPAMRTSKALVKSNRQPRTGRLPQITSLDTSKLPRESGLLWKGNNDIRTYGQGYPTDKAKPPRQLTREQTFKITPAGYDSRFTDLPLPLPPDDTPQEVKVKAISKCSEWMNKYM